MTLDQRIRALRAQSGLTQEEFGARVGVSVQSVSQWETPERPGQARRPPRPSKDRLVTIAREFGARHAWLLSGEGPMLETEVVEGPVMPLPPPDASHPIPLLFSHKTIPVYGHAAGGMNDDGKFILNGSKIADVLCPPALEGVVGAYAVYHTGESMLPRYEPGDLLTIHPTLPVKRGDYVLVQIKGEDGDPPYGYVKRFVSKNAKELVLEQLNPPEGQEQTLRFPAERVLTVHAIWGASRG